MRIALKILIGLQAVLLLLFAAVHFGLPIPWLAEPRLPLHAAIEGACGLFLLYASLHEGARMAFWAQAAAFGSVLLTMVALALGGVLRAPITEFGIVLLLLLLAPGGLIADRLARD